MLTTSGSTSVYQKGNSFSTTLMSEVDKGEENNCGGNNSRFVFCQENILVSVKFDCNELEKNTYGD